MGTSGKAHVLDASAAMPTAKAAGPAEDVRGYLRRLVREVERCTSDHSPPDEKLVAARKAGEAISRSVLGRGHDRQSLCDLRGELGKSGLAARDVCRALSTIAECANPAAHVRDPEPEDLEGSWLQAKAALIHVLRWLVRDHIPSLSSATVPWLLRRRLGRGLNQLGGGGLGERIARVLLPVLLVGLPGWAIGQATADPAQLADKAEATKGSESQLAPADESTPTTKEAARAVTNPEEEPPAPAPAAVPAGEAAEQDTLTREPTFVAFPDQDRAELWLQESEATVEQYRACVAAGACDEGALNVAGETDGSLPFLCTGSTSDNLLAPINCINGNEASALCTWLGERATGRAGRIPTVKEWRAGTRWEEQRRRFFSENDRRYAFKANLCDRSFLAAHSHDPFCTKRSATATFDDGHVGPAPVGTTEPATPHGLHDVLGNVTELAKTAGGAYARVGRGFRVAVTATSKAALSSQVKAESRYAHGGVRCVVDAAQP